MPFRRAGVQACSLRRDVNLSDEFDKRRFFIQFYAMSISFFTQMENADEQIDRSKLGVFGIAHEPRRNRTRACGCETRFAAATDCRRHAEGRQAGGEHPDGYVEPR